jgi:plastocyanin
MSSFVVCHSWRITSLLSLAFTLLGRIDLTTTRTPKGRVTELDNAITRRTRRRRAVRNSYAIALILVVLAVALGIVYLGFAQIRHPRSSQQSTTSNVNGGAVVGASGEVTIPLNAGGYFDPATVVVYIGKNNTVTWVNLDKIPHSVTSEKGLFDSGVIAQNQTFTYTFNQPGAYGYKCIYHAWMTGIVIVKN